VCSQVASVGLVFLNSLEQGFEISSPEALMVSALDDFHEEGGSVLEWLCENL
jgi:hypothetical protein